MKAPGFCLELDDLKKEDKMGRIKQERYWFLMLLIYLTAGSGFAWASSVGIELRPSTQIVQSGDSVDIEAYFMDYDPVFDKDYYAGSSFSLLFDSTVLAFSSWTPGPGLLTWTPTTGFPIEETAPFSGNLLPGASGLLIATAHFNAVGLGQSTVSVPTDGLFLSVGAGEFAPGVIRDKALIGLTTADVNVVPLPGAVWLLGCGLISLACLRGKIKDSVCQ
jgi:hypothetical protein